MLLGFVNSTLGRKGRARDVVNQQFKILIRDGHIMDFWYDDWTGRDQLWTCSLEFMLWPHLNRVM